MVTFETYMKLVAFVESKGCKVIFDENKKISFNLSKMTITVPQSITLENAYALAHEIGHLIDHLNNELDHDKWLNDMSYRITAEMSAWVHAYKLLSHLDISLDKYHTHVNSKLSSYFKYHNVVQPV
ncbi:hypothetical protein ABES80_04955 [Bacillus gobiensis]|uniref:hypothetical protein n=1 Tax=Bacillus gobiensis TaxID=1441095 RepID=UPI003D23817C